MARSKTKVKRMRHRWILKKRRREEAKKKALIATSQPARDYERISEGQGVEGAENS